MILTEANKFIHERFEEQRHLLQKSIKDVSSGDLAEAIRIASIIRVLVHETGSSKPLLKQLTKDYLQLQVLDYPERDSRVPHPSRFRRVEIPTSEHAAVPCQCPTSDRVGRTFLSDNGGRAALQSLP